MGAKDRASNQVNAKVVEHADAATLHAFVDGSAKAGATGYTDNAKVYRKMPLVLNDIRHESVKHSVGESVRGKAHTNGVEAFWAALKRAHKGTFHKISPKHLNRYVHEFVGKHNIRRADTAEQMRDVVAGLFGRRLLA